MAAHGVSRTLDIVWKMSFIRCIWHIIRNIWIIIFMIQIFIFIENKFIKRSLLWIYYLFIWILRKENKNWKENNKIWKETHVSIDFPREHTVSLNKCWMVWDPEYKIDQLNWKK